jgi:hypothetical protein
MTGKMLPMSAGRACFSALVCGLAVMKMLPFSWELVHQSFNRHNT